MVSSMKTWIPKSLCANRDQNDKSNLLHLTLKQQSPKHMVRICFGQETAAVYLQHCKRRELFELSGAKCLILNCYRVEEGSLFCHFIFFLIFPTLFFLWFLSGDRLRFIMKLGLVVWVVSLVFLFCHRMISMSWIQPCGLSMSS